MTRSLGMVRGHGGTIAAAIAVCAPVLWSSAVSAAGAPSPAASPSAAVPQISIADGCSYKTLSSGFSVLGGGATVLGHGSNFFFVTFTNNAAVAADRIVFQIDFGKASRIVIPDAGTFAPGATVKQTLRDKGKDMLFSARPSPNDGSVICSVLSAHFTDGTSYTSPLAPVASPSR